MPTPSRLTPAKKVSQFIDDILTLQERVNAFAPHFQSTYARLYEDDQYADLDEDEIVALIGEKMQGEFDAIRSRFSSLELEGFPSVAFIGFASKAYLPRGTNAPKKGKPETKAQTNFDSARARIELLASAFDEMRESFLIVFGEIDSGTSIDSSVFSSEWESTDVSEGMEILLKALKIFAEDYPGIISVDDHLRLEEAVLVYDRGMGVED